MGVAGRGASTPGAARLVSREYPKFSESFANFIFSIFLNTLQTIVVILEHIPWSSYFITILFMTWYHKTSLYRIIMSDKLNLEKGTTWLCDLWWNNAFKSEFPHVTLCNYLRLIQFIHMNMPVRQLTVRLSICVLSFFPIKKR